MSFNAAERVASVSESRSQRLMALRTGHPVPEVRQYLCFLELTLGNQELDAVAFVDNALNSLAYLMRARPRTQPLSALKILYLISVHFKEILAKAVEPWEFAEAERYFNAKLQATLLLLAARGVGQDALARLV